MEKEIEKRFEYVIKVNGKDVWHGLNPEEKFDEMAAKNLGKKVSVAWRTHENIFGRVGGLDLFDANFLNGEKIKLQWGG